MAADLILTIESDDEQTTSRVLSREGRADEKQSANTDDLDPTFSFDIGSSSNVAGLDLWGEDVVQSSHQQKPLTVDDIIERRLGRPVLPYKERKKARETLDSGTEDENGEEEEETEEQDEGKDEEDDEDDDSNDEGMDLDDDDDEVDDDEDEEDKNGGDEDSEDDSDDGEEEEDATELARKAAFFADGNFDQPAESTNSFSSMKLSRSILRALTSLNFTQPTPIQSKAIPLALQGRDILGSAVTGSGKTVAFMVPILERLSYRDRSRTGQACRVLILCPTRELAVQCENVGKAIVAKGGLDIRFALLVGGLSLSVQAHTLRSLPDVLIATPGRLIDHLTNTPSFTLSALDILVIDEADRMLEAGFNDELEEIIKSCPVNRQTMLFSATMTDSVDELVKLSLNKPIRVFVDQKRSTAAGLVQEFVRIRSEESRTPSLLALCKRTVKERCIIFFRTKQLAHQMRVAFGLLGLKAVELHGNLSQEQRLTALTDFKAGKVDYLLATDLASRGLDIKGVETVINYDMPGQLAQYTHRVGRTARAGRNGRSISLVGEPDRKMLKAVIKQSESHQIRHRIIPSEAVADLTKRLEEIKDTIQEVLKEEKEEKILQQADMEIRKGQNMVKHEAEIFARPARTWFQSEKEKLAAKEAGKAAHQGTASAPNSSISSSSNKIKRGKYDGLSRRQKRRKMAAEEDGDIKSGISAAIRRAKKSSLPSKISVPLKDKTSGGSSKGKKSKGKVAVGFGGKSSEGMRSVKGGKVNLDKKGKKKSRTK